ncbi:MAG: hydrogenase expression/formation protein HypE, partial [Betaproteobacteria bacterium]|nr:hydrogenase expression/formation protein HypE [Betaproteobacteria bacterium]
MNDLAENSAVIVESGIRPRSGRVRDANINMAHGSGGKAMRDLIEDVFLDAFDNPALAALEDQAVFPLAQLAALGDRLAFTTDTY